MSIRKRLLLYVAGWGFAGFLLGILLYPVLCGLSGGGRLMTACLTAAYAAYFPGFIGGCVYLYRARK